MLELIGEMILCLIVAILLGFLIGWLFGRAMGAEEYNIDYDELSVREEEHNSEVKDLESRYNKEKRLVKECEKKNRELKGQLMQKVNLLEKTSDTLQELQQRHNSTDDGKRLIELEALLKQKDAELVEFETVLIKAEQTIEKLKSSFKKVEE
jgi:chromosome segregation ATPase